MHEIFDELIEGQRKKLLELAQTLVPRVTEEDLLQPFDFPLLENHPGFRHEEGVLEGLMAARMAICCELTGDAPEAEPLGQSE